MLGFLGVAMLAAAAHQSRKRRGLSGLNGVKHEEYLDARLAVSIARNKAAHAQEDLEKAERDLSRASIAYRDARIAKYGKDPTQWGNDV